MYKSAIPAAKTKGDSSKARRYERGMKTQQDMSRTLEVGTKVNMDDLSLEVAVPGGDMSGGLPPSKVPARQDEGEEDDMVELQSLTHGWLSSHMGTPVLATASSCISTVLKWLTYTQVIHPYAVCSTGIAVLYSVCVCVCIRVFSVLSFLYC